MELMLGGEKIAVNEEGYLLDLAQWNRQIGTSIAESEGIAMTDEHWKVIEYIQDQYKKEIPLSIRKIKNSGVVSIKDLYRLFPGGPLKISSKIAGIPKPASCV